MYEKGAKQKQAIIEAADRLIYERGYEATSFTDIAAAAKFNRGNFYHYFKSKDAILAAVADRREEWALTLLESWEREIPTPLGRLKRFVRLWSDNAADVARYGCPLGTLNAELGKGERPYQSLARQLARVYSAWLVRQFREMGLGEASDAYARRLFALIQGEAMLAHVFGDAAHLKDEAADISVWLESLA
jgi:TetR/AcrR family transcriptional repressor of nem operon